MHILCAQPADKGSGAASQLVIMELRDTSAKMVIPFVTGPLTLDRLMDIFDNGTATAITDNVLGSRGILSLVLRTSLELRHH